MHLLPVYDSHTLKNGLPFESMPTCSCRSMTLLSMCLTSHIQTSSVHWKKQNSTRSWWRDECLSFPFSVKQWDLLAAGDHHNSLSHPFCFLPVCLSLCLTYTHEVPQALISTCGCSWILGILEKVLKFKEVVIATVLLRGFTCLCGTDSHFFGCTVIGRFVMIVTILVPTSSYHDNGMNNVEMCVFFF